MEPSKEAISLRIARLNNLFCNKSTATANYPERHWVSREGLLDSLIVLYDECNNDTLKRDKHIANFVDKFRSIVTEIRRLRVNITDFEVKKVIGRGHFGEVHLVREKQTGDVYAMKKLRKSDTLSQQFVAFYEEERNIMAYATSPWLTSLQYAFQDMNHLYLVMEFHPGGDLLALLERFDGSLSEDMARFYLAELTLSIHSLHSMKYVHRDIKPDNILIDRCGHLKLADFGSAAKLNGAGVVMSEMPVGTPEYIAPEALAAMESTGKGKNRKGTYGVECDYWSLGIVAFEMLFGHTPFSGDRLMNTYCNIMNHKDSLVFPEDREVSNEFQTLVVGLLKSADQRLGYEQLQQQKFFATIDWNGIRETVPPFVPVVNGQDDTSNFVEFDHETPMPSIANFKVKREFSGQNLPFIGFTYAPDVIVNSNTSECSVSPKKDSLKQKIEDLQTMLQNATKGGREKNKEIEALERKIEEKDKRLQNLECDRNKMEDEFSKYISETKSLKKLIEFERKERIEMEGKTIELVSDAKQKWMKREKQKIGQLHAEIKSKDAALAAANDQVNELSAALKKKEEELNTIRNESQHLQIILSEHKSKINKVHENRRSSVAGIENRLEKLTLDGQKQIDELQSQLESERNRRNELERKLHDLEGSMRGDNFKWDELLEKHRREISQLTSKLENQGHELERAKLAYGNLNLEFMQSQSQENKMLEEQIQMLEDSLLKKDNECQELRRSLMKIEGEFNESLMSIEGHCENVVSEKLALVSQLERELKEAEKEKVHLKHKIRESDSREREYQNRVDTLQDMFKRLEDNLSKLTEENEKLKGGDKEIKLDDIAEEKNTLYEENQVLSAQLKKVEAQLQKVMEEKIVEKQSAKSVQSDLWKKEKELSDMKIDLRIAKREAKTAEEQLKTLLEEKKKINEKLISEKAEHAEILKVKCEEISSLGKKIIDLQQKLTAVEGDFSSYKEKASNEKQQLEARVQSLTQSEKEASFTQQSLCASQEECKNLESQVKRLEKNEREWNEKIFKIEAKLKSVQNELEVANRKIEAAELNSNLLRQACVEMEEQLEDYQKLVSAHETKKMVFEEERKGLIGQLEKERAEAVRWKKSFEKEETKYKELELKWKELLHDAEERDDEYREEIQAVKDHCSEYKNISEQLTEQVNDLEEQLNCVSRDLKMARKHEEALQVESAAVKEESASLLTQIHSLRESNHKLTSDLEEALSNCHSLRLRVEGCEAVTGELESLYRHREIKMEATIKQQTKLIDYLQSMNEGKKKKTLSDRLFGTHGNTTNGVPAQNASLRNRDLETQLSMERAKNKRLMDDFMRAKAELLAIQESNHHGKELDCFRRSATLQVPVTPKSKQVISQLVQSPDAQTPSRKPSLQRMHHKIPHRFEMKMNMRPVKCAACLDSVHFGRHAAVCQECGMIAHPKCSLLLPTTCGLPFQFVRHFSESWKNGMDSKEDSHKETNSPLPKMEGWVKLLKHGKACWERKYLRLEDLGQVLKVYDHQPTDNLSPVQTFELSSPDGGVATVLGAVPLSEVVNTAKSDLPYILKVEIGSGTTCWPGGRSLLIMALSFPEKQAWVSCLESAVTALKTKGDRNLTHSRYQGEVVSHLHGVNFLSLNCCQHLSNDLLLLGAEEGLYSLRMNNGKMNRNHPVRILGVDCVYQLTLLKSLGLAVMIAGEGRQLIQVDLRELLVAAEAAECSCPKISYKPIEGGLESCHLFAAQAINPHDSSALPVLCAASSEKITIMKWHAEQKSFILCKVMETAEPCSCLHFAPHSVIVGCDKFFEVDLKDYSVEEFLDSSDTSLAYAVLGTHQLNSFPVAVLDISNSVTNPEYLLCFHEFAVFVDAYGRRTREADVKWSHISFAFAFQKPYLFIFHFALVEVLKITSKSFTVSEKGSDVVNYPQQVMLELPNPQFLGTSISHGTIFLSISSDIKYGELLKLEGNLACPEIEDGSISTLDTYGLQSDADDGISNQDDPSEFSFTSSVVQTLEDTDEDDRSKGNSRRVQFENNARH